VGADGKRRPPRPQIEVLTGGASESETAAIAAALELFLAETAPSPATGAAHSRWQRAALEEGVSARAAGGQGWGPALPSHPGSG
jgi:hypothetical protein